MLKVALVGFGWFGRIHKEVWEQISSVEVVAICDLDPDRFNERTFEQDAFHAGSSQAKASSRQAPKRYCSLAELLANEEIDLVDIVVNEHDHFTVAKFCLEQRISVFVEKPLCLTRGDSLQLRELASGNSARIFAGHLLRFDARYQSAFEEIQRRSTPVRYMSFSRHFQSRAHSVYGRVHPIFGALIHDIDLAIWFKGSAPAQVQAFASHVLHKENPDIVTAHLLWEDGTIAQLGNAWHLAPGCPFGFAFDSTIMADGTTLRVSNQPDLEIWSAEESSQSPELFFWPMVGTKRRGALFHELSAVAECLLSGTSSFVVPAEEAHATICVADALIESLMQKAPVQVRLDA